MRTLTGVLAGLVLLGSAALSLSRFTDTTQRWVVAASSFSGYALLGYVVALVLLLLLLRGGVRRGVVALGLVAALAGVAAHAAWLAPSYVGAGAGATDVVVMTSNLEFGRGDAGDLARVVATERVDVLVLEETTPAVLARLDRTPVARSLPHRAGRASDGADGTVVLSRWPLGTSVPFRIGNGGVQVPVRGPDPFTLLAVHADMPLITPDTWRRDLRTVQDRVARLGGGSVVVAGDFNATRDHRPFREIEAAGVRDAAAQSGAGWQPTWPTSSRRPWLRPLIGIDHVLSDDRWTATGTDTRRVDGTDHRALVARLHHR